MHLDYIKKYGKVFSFCFGSRLSLVVADPELVKQIMVKEFPNFRNRFQVLQPEKFFSKIVANARDATWKRIRNTLTPTFSAGKMKLMVPLIEKSCDTLVVKLGEIADSGELRFSITSFPTESSSNKRSFATISSQRCGAYSRKSVQEEVDCLTVAYFRF